MDIDAGLHGLIDAALKYDEEMGIEEWYIQVSYIWIALEFFMRWVIRI